MPVQITIPSPGESVTEVTVGHWQKRNGDWVEQDEPLVEIESDKVTLEVPAPASGVLEVAAEQGAELRVGDVIGAIDDAAARPSGDHEPQRAARPSATDVRAAAPAETASANETATWIAAAAPETQRRATSLARRIAADKGVDLAAVAGTGPAGRITKSDVLAVAETSVSGRVPPASAPAAQAIAAPAARGERGMRREKMTKLRRRIAERLVAAQHQAAMLTTFNECDMTEVVRLRKRHKEAFQEKHGVGLGFMSFFVKASAAALRAFPRVNASIAGDEIEFHDFIDISIAVGTDRGLVVPILRDVQEMSFANIEAAIRDFAARARDGKLTLEEMTGGTFTITNGGIYGSLNSTPILNPPQSGILGMHAIKNRAVEDPDHPGQLALRPMMYLALSYDHRIVDGAEAVGFLVHIKNAIESPERLLLEV